ncbi:MAG: rhodanese-like domain-containing protein [Alphaproteobacteria bacterium]|nr:rhodanese-like domain-containing protein [Alphaproteobacteria bacterium]
MTRHANRRVRALGAAAAIFVAAGAATTAWRLVPATGPWRLDPTDPRVSLADVEREVARRHPVPDIAPAALAPMLAGGKVVLFDVRTEEEFAAGHLPGAIRVEPGMEAGEFLGLHRDRLGVAPVVFYCAVGVRSSQMMMRTLERIAPHATGGIYNLRGGIFRWTADGRALVRGDAQGEAHPFDANWGQLLSRSTTAP